MLKDQLEEIRKKRRTLFDTRNSATVRFIEEDDVDTETLLNLITFGSSFTKPKSLNFDRHQLSEKEEAKFNLKFTPFLKSIISRMHDDGIGYLLEYLVRIYSIDTFNQKELTFLLLPFKQYFSQLSAISKMGRSQFSSLKAYSIHSISKILLRDRTLFVQYVEYFKHYHTLKDFLDRSLDELIEMVKSSNFDYVDEFYQIMTILIDQSAHAKALEIYHRMKSYLDSDEFVKLLAPYNLEKDLLSTQEDSVIRSKFEIVYKNGSGRSFLKSQNDLVKYLQYLDSNGIMNPSEFSVDEYKVLRFLFLRKRIDDVENRNLIDLYREIMPKIGLTQYLLRSGALKDFYDSMDDESIFCAIKESETDPLLDLMSESNHACFLRNMKADLFQRHFRQIVEKCIRFRNFDSSLFKSDIDFENLVDKNFSKSVSTSCSQANVIILAQTTNFDLTSLFLGQNIENKLVLGYLLRSNFKFDLEFLNILYNTAKRLCDSALISGLVSFVCRTQINLHDFCYWAKTSGFILSINDVVHTHGDLIDSEFHFDYFLATDSSTSLQILIDRNYNIVERLCEVEDYQHLMQISKIYGIKTILISHPFVLSIISKLGCAAEEKSLGAGKDDARDIVDYLISNTFNSQEIPLLINFVDVLIEFRDHSSWPVLRTIMIESLSNFMHAQEILQYIVSHLSLFTSEDADLFDKIFTFDVNFELSSLVANEDASATLINSYIKQNMCSENLYGRLLPSLPYITPLLIKNKIEAATYLFETFTNIIGTYSECLLLHYPEKADLLLGIDPRFSVKALCKHFGESSLTVLMKIFESQTTRSSSVIDVVSDVFVSHLGHQVQSEHLLGFLRFYARSFGCSANEQITNLFVKAYKFYKPIFFGVAQEISQDLPSLLLDMLPFLVNDISSQTNDPNVYLLLSQILISEDADLEEPISLIKKIYKAHNVYSAEAIGSVCRSRSEVLEVVLQHIIKYMKKGTDLSYCIEILISVVQKCNISKELKDFVVSNTIEHTENRDASTANKASELLHLLTK